MQIACFHIDGFPSWVRAQRTAGRARNPRVAVHYNRRIICRSAALQSAGLAIGEEIERARSLFPDAAFHPSDPDMEEAVWETVLHMLADAGPHLLSLRPGWALLQPYDMMALERIATTLGGSLGVGPRRFIAMLAALEGEAGRSVRVGERDAGSFLERTSVGRLERFGIDAETIERLELFGLVTLGRLSGLKRRHLQAQFGRAGSTIHDLLHPAGDDPAIPLFQPPPTLSATYDLEEPSVEPGELLPVLEHLVQEVTLRLGGLRAHLLTLRLAGRGARGGGLLRRVLKRPAAAIRPIRAAAIRLLEQMLAPDDPIDAMTVELGGLLRPEIVQESLFDERPLIYETVRLIHRRYPGRLLRATIIDPHSYIPEDGIRLEPYPEMPPEKKKRRGKR